MHKDNNFIIENLPIGYVVKRILFNEDSTPYDYEFIKINKNFESIVGLKKEDIINKKATEIFNIKSGSENKWIKTFGELAKYGEGSFVEECSEIYMGYYKIRYFSPEKDYVVVYVEDIINEVEYIEKLTELENQICELKNKYKTILSNVYDWETISLKDEGIIHISPSCERISGYTADEFLKDDKLFFSIIVDEDKKIWTDHLDSGLMDYGYAKVHFRIRNKEGQIIWIEHISSPIISEEGNIIGNRSNNRDITKEKLNEISLKKSESMYRFITEHVSDVIWIYNITKNAFTYISSAIYLLTGYTAEDFIEKKFDEIIKNENKEIIIKQLSDQIVKFNKNSEENYRVLEEFKQVKKDGTPIWVEVSAQLRYNPEAQLEIIGVSRDITQRKKIDDQIRYLSYYDQLTDLPNRRFYEERLRKLDVDSKNLPISLLVADVNGLKLANDAFGHKTGDKLLKAFATILKKQIRANDFIARVAGDEFVILLPNTDLKTAKKISTRIKKIAETVTVENIILSASIGCAVKLDINEDIENIFSKAEDNMYKNKLSESNEVKSATIRFIEESLFKKSPREEEHSKNVSRICGEIGIVMGLSINKISDLLLLGLYHDIGKIGIDEKILNKKEPLNEIEWYEMRKHPEIGYQILRTVNEFASIAEYILYHHERIDGKGYPQGLTGENIPLEAKILSIANAYDYMTSPNSYKKALSKEEAINQLRRHSNTQFDKEIVDIFIAKVLNKISP